MQDLITFILGTLGRTNQPLSPEPLCMLCRSPLSFSKTLWVVDIGPIRKPINITRGFLYYG